MSERKMAERGLKFTYTVEGLEETVSSWWPVVEEVIEGYESDELVRMIAPSADIAARRKASERLPPGVPPVLECTSVELVDMPWVTVDDNDIERFLSGEGT